MLPNAPDTIIACHPDVFNHNLETVPRLYPDVRPGAHYGRSLALLRSIADKSDILTKSGLMLGLGETKEELQKVFDDLAENKVQALTIGQYLAPSSDHFPVVRYVPPEEFEDLGQLAKAAGIKFVMSAPLVRSSYKAEVYKDR